MSTTMNVCVGWRNMEKHDNLAELVSKSIELGPPIAVTLLPFSHLGPSSRRDFSCATNFSLGYAGKSRANASNWRPREVSGFPVWCSMVSQSRMPAVARMSYLDPLPRNGLATGDWIGRWFWGKTLSLHILHLAKVCRSGVLASSNFKPVPLSSPTNPVANLWRLCNLVWPGPGPRALQQTEGHISISAYFQGCRIVLGCFLPQLLAVFFGFSFLVPFAV